MSEAQLGEEQSFKFPVSVVVECQTLKDSRWESTRWEVVGVVSAEEFTEAEPQVKRIHGGDGAEQYLWSGFSVELFKDDAESYYFNLRGDEPKVFVICRRDEDDQLEPFLVTLSYDEASSYMEVEDDVYSVPIPPEIYQGAESYVINNYVPSPLKKRKRSKWYKGARGDE